MNITINISDELYDSLKRAAAANHRSINNEAIACLEKTLLPRKISSSERIAQVRHISEGIKTRFSSADILKAINAGRRAQ